MAALIGTTRWDPYGESMLSIVRRIQEQNYLKTAEIVRLAGKKRSSSIAWARPFRPDNAEAWDLERLCALAGWQPQQLEASFSTFYLPSGKHRVSGGRFELNHVLESELRICALCATQGVHLLCHQLVGWSACPLHHQPLMTRCPDCRCAFGRYHYSAGPACRLTRCPECGWNSGAIAAVDTATRRDRLGAYRQWIQQLESLDCGRDAKRLWIGHPDLINDSARIHALLPGPSWLSRCLASSHRVRISQITDRRLRYIPAPAEGIERLTDLEVVRGFKPPDALIARVQSHNECLVERLVAQRYSKGNTRWNGRVGRTGKLELRVGSETLISHMTRWLWRWAVDELLPWQQRWGYDGQPGSTFIGTSLHGYWQAGPGLVAWRHASRSREAWTNRAVFEWLDRHWRERMLRDLFYALVPRSGLVMQQDCIRDDGHVSELMVDANTLAGLPLSILEADGQGVSVRTASILREPEVFEQFFAAERPGHQKRMISSLVLQDELFELLGTAAKHRAISRRACEYWALYLSARSKVPAA